MPSGGRYCLASIGPRASAVSRLVAEAAASKGVEIQLLELDARADAQGLLAAIASASSLPASGACRPAIAADGYSGRALSVVKLLLERLGPSARPLVFLLPPYPYEKRLEGRYRFNAGFLASSASSSCVVVGLEYGEELLALRPEEFEGRARGALAEVLLDFLVRSSSPPLSELLDGDGGYLLVVGSFGDARRLALEGAGYDRPAVAVVREGSAAELLTASSASAALGGKVDVAAGSASYLVVSREDLAREDPLYEALGPRFLDPSPSFPARVDWLPDLYEM